MSQITEIKYPLEKPEKPFSVGIVTALFNEDITLALEKGALQCLADSRVTEIHRCYVPGAVEISLAAKKLLETKSVDGVITLGLVIRGETTHYDYVCSAAERGCTTLQLETGKPIAFGVLTTENRGQALNRAGGKKGNKGFDAAECLLNMISLNQRLDF